MSKTKHLIILLDSLEKREFDKIVKIYLQNLYGYERITFTDGKDDMGIDIKVFDFKGQNIQFQLTTQKSNTTGEMYSFTKKVKEDLAKAKLNFTDFNYKDKLIFFYSKTLTPKKISELKKLALDEYDIDLEMIDANQIAQEAENVIEIQAELYRISELDRFQIEDSSFENTILYDLLSFGKPTEFKVQVIDAFILQLFFQNIMLTKETIVKSCEEQFNVKENDVFYEKLLSRFQTARQIKKDKGSLEYSLTSEERTSLKNKNDLFDLDKKLFIKQIGEILKPYSQEEHMEKYIVQLKQLYIDNFDIDLSAIINNDEENPIFNKHKEFTKFIEEHLKDKIRVKTLANELLKYCLNNKFIQKIAATKVYSSKIDNNKLEKYISIKKKIFIDTNIGLHSLCYFYKPKNENSDYFYRATKNLLEFAKKEGIPLNISERYMREIRGHIIEAFNLIPFTSIPSFEKLGFSRNIFYNFYIYLKLSNSLEYEKTFLAFLGDFGFAENNSEKSLNSAIEASLSQVNIKKQVISKHYNIDETNRLFDDVLLDLNKNKSNFTRDNDSIMVEFLADTDTEIHTLRPLFITWDKSFFEVHKEYTKKYPDAQKWLMLTPNRIVDAYSLLKFSINSETVTENLLALISDDIINSTKSLVDTLSIILNLKEEVGLAYVNRLASIRETEINRVNSEESAPRANFKSESIIDDIFIKLTDYYRNKDTQLKDFKKIFTKMEYMDSIIGILDKSIKYSYNHETLPQNLCIDFDAIIEEMNADTELMPN